MLTIHRPHHILKSPSGYFFITARTYSSIPHLITDKARSIFKTTLFDKAHKYAIMLPNWTVMDNHYHLLLHPKNCDTISPFIQELHGASSFQIKKLPIADVTLKGQMGIRENTPLERRNEKKVERLWCGLKSAINQFFTSELQLAPYKRNHSFTSRLQSAPHKCGLKSAIDLSFTTKTISRAGTECSISRADRNKHISLADFSLRLKEEMDKLNFAQKTIDTVLNTAIKYLYNAFISNKFNEFSFYLLTQLPDIPFWYNYTTKNIKNERDFYMHFNYITQNPIKHGVVKRVWDYAYSGIFDYDRHYITDMLRQYPIVDFGGSYE